MYIRNHDCTFGCCNIGCYMWYIVHVYSVTYASVCDIILEMDLPLGCCVLEVCAYLHNEIFFLKLALVQPCSAPRRASTFRKNYKKIIRTSLVLLLPELTREHWWWILCFSHKNKTCLCRKGYACPTQPCCLKLFRCYNLYYIAAHHKWCMGHSKV